MFKIANSVQNSRRSFLRKALGGGAAVLTASVLPLVRAETPCAACIDSLTDVDILNYALTLEHLEAAFYVEGLNTFGADSFRKGEFVKRLGHRVAGQIFPYLEIIREHELTHVQALIATITMLGGTPVGPCTYDFGYSTVEEFLKVAQILENTGVSAYDGAIHLICDPSLQTTGATIATVEARHAAYLNLVNGEVPFPSAFDTPKTMEEILAAAGQFIVSCP